MKRLNGWKRIGIVVSIVWFVCTYFYILNDEMGATTRYSVTIVDSCIDARGGVETPDNACLKEGEKYAEDELPEERRDAALYAFIPILFGWGFVYLVLFVVRWVRRGFASA
jgi:hypothetical protein